MDAAIQAAVAGIDDPLLALHEQRRAYVRFGMEHPEHYRIMFMGPAYETPDQWDELLSTGSFANPDRALPSRIDADVVSASTDPFIPAQPVLTNTQHGQQARRTNSEQI